MAGNMGEDDAAEGIDAFLEKRMPQWNNQGNNQGRNGFCRRAALPYDRLRFHRRMRTPIPCIRID